MAARNVVNIAALAATIALVAAQATAAQVSGLRDSLAGGPDSLEGKPIRRIGIVARNIYEPLPPGPLRPLYRLANAVHVRTRATTIRHALLVRPGEAWADSRGRENMRALRSLGILEPVSLAVTSAGDSVDLHVLTQDDWTTQSEFAIQSAQGESFTSASLTEQNLFGLGKSISLSYREAPEGITRDAAYLDPNVFGSRARLAAHAGRGSEGVSEGADFGVPFYAENTPHSYGIRWSLVTSVARLFQGGDQTADFDRHVEETEAYWGQGFQIGGNIVRLTGSFVVRDRRYGASRLDPGAPAEFAGDEENVHERRWGGEARWWKPGFVELEGVDRLGGVEDVDLGPSARLIGGFSPRLLGATADEGYLAAKFDGGLPIGARTYALANLDFRTRLRNQPLETVARSRARWVAQPRPEHTFVLASYGAAAYRPERDFQEILGGLSGLRALPVRGLTGHQAWRFNAEHRWLVGHDIFQLVSLGTATFYDLGRTWGPGAPEGGWRQDVGVGLRIALPRSGQDRVARIDIAWPIARRPGDDPGPVLSFGSGQAF